MNQQFARQPVIDSGSPASATAGHAVQFYESDRFLCDSVASFFIVGIRLGESIVLVATRAHTDAISDRLTSMGIDIAELCRSRRAIFVDAAQMLAETMSGEEIDEKRCRLELASVIQDARLGHPQVPIRIYGELVDLLCQQGNTAAALRLEEIWNELAVTFEFSLLCGYAFEHFADSSRSGWFEATCQRHSRVMPTERYTKALGDKTSVAEVALLEQRALALQAELARRAALEHEIGQMRGDVEQLQLQRERLMAAECAARRDAEAAHCLKDEFLAALSHELRTPLNVILGWVQLAGRPNGDETTLRRGLDVIGRNAEIQMHVIDDLLDVSRFVTGRMQVKMAKVDLAELIQDSVEAVRPAVTAKAIELFLRVDRTVRHIAGDRDRLQQVLWNLFSNAVRFTPEHGHIEVRLEEDAAHACIVVRDNGRGIRPEFLPYVFDRFRQGDTGMTRTHGGLGLGLAVARHLVEAHGGAITAASDGEGQGSTFTVILPWDRPDAPSTST